MPVSADVTVFPNNAVNILRNRFEVIYPDMFVTTRPLRDSDPVQCIAVVPSMWDPQDNSYEMKNHSLGWHEPTLQRFIIVVQALVKHMDEATGMAEHSTLANIVRSTLYRDNTLRIELGSLVWTNGSYTERAKRWGINNQRFVSNEIGGVWHYVSSLEFWLETETV